MKENIFNKCDGLNELIREYFMYSKKYHMEGDPQNQMHKIQKDFMAFYANIYFENLPQAKEDLDQFPQLLDTLYRLEGVKFELIGSWIWLSGATNLHKDSLKELGLRYEPKKQRYYWRPSWGRSKNQNPLPMEQIKQIYQGQVEREAAFHSKPEPAVTPTITMNGNSFVHAGNR